MQGAQGLGTKQRMSAAKANLRKTRTFAHQHGKRARTDFGIKRAVIAGFDTVEPARLVGNHAGKHIESAGGTFRIGGGRNLVGKRQAFQQRHNIDTPGLENRAVGQRDFVQLEFVNALGNRRAARQKTCAHPVGHLTQPQIEARRLDLIGHERALG